MLLKEERPKPKGRGRGFEVGRELSLEAEGQGRRRGAESLMQKRRADTYAKEEGRGYMEEA
jgi:hypothetical protein